MRWNLVAFCLCYLYGMLTHRSPHSLMQIMLYARSIVGCDLFVPDIGATSCHKATVLPTESKVFYIAPMNTE